MSTATVEAFPPVCSPKCVCCDAGRTAVAELNQRLIDRTAAYEARERTLLARIAELERARGATGIELAVCEEIARRQRMGVAKYGQTLAENPAGRGERLQHILEELLDGACYVKWELERAGAAEGAALAGAQAGWKPTPPCGAALAGAALAGAAVDGAQAGWKPTPPCGAALAGAALAGAPAGWKPTPLSGAAMEGGSA